MSPSIPPTSRVLTGDRPTGPLHLGHHFGTLQNRVRAAGAGRRALRARRRLPDDHRPRFAGGPARRRRRASWPTTSRSASTPTRATIFAHSQVGALNQLIVPFLSLVSVAEVRRNPTVKEEMRATGGAAMSALMFTYPVHQAADILFCRATVVPVGRDQLPHVELARLDREAVQHPLRRPRRRSSPSRRRCSGRPRSCSASTAAR